MSAFFHRGHDSSSVVKRFVGASRAYRRRRLGMPESIKAEPIDYIFTTFPPVSRAQTIRSSSSTTPLPEPVMSSGNTTVADDALMADMNAHYTPHGSSDGTMEMDDVVLATSTPTVSQGTRSMPQRRQHDRGVGTSSAADIVHNTDALHTLALGSRELIKTIQSLSALNIEATLPSLPKFVVVGDQSAGKSSIIEACCDITLPRSEGTCTRCPFEITTTALTEGTDGAWRCTISLVSAYSYSPFALPQDAFHPWHATQRQITMFAVVTNKSQLEHQLKLAQLAILNPDKDPASFATLRDPSQATMIVGFSPNIIRLEVQAPEQPELSFFDLPGAINVHPDETQQHLVGFIKAVIESYLRDPQTKISLTCGADQDVENCTAFRFIKDSQAIDRCFGVLTKLDLVHISRMKIVERMLNRKDYALPQGSWFVTKQPSQSDLEAGISHEEARNIEHSFFNQPYWQRVVQDFPQQVGIGNLQQAISQIYTGTIRDHLPEIIERVNARYAAITQELAGFAEEPSHPASIVTSEVHKVQFAISVQLDPDGPAKNLYKRTLTKLINFATELHKLQPTIDWQTRGYVQPPFSVDDSSDDDATPSKVVNTPAPKVKGSKGSGSAVTSVGAGRKHQLPTRSTPGPTTARKLFANQTPSQASKSTIAPTAFTLAQIREEYDVSDPDPRATNSSHVTNSLTLTTLRPWTQSTTAALSRIQNDFLTSLTAIVNEILAPRLRTKFYATMQVLLATNAKSLFHKASLAINHALEKEQYRPMLTANTDRWKLLAAPVEAKLSEQRHRKRVEEHFDRVEAHLDASKHSSTELRLKRASEAVWRAANADPYTRYVPHLVKIVTYYGIAASRFADTVTGIVTFELCREFGETVEAVLKKGLKMGDDGACKKLLEEDPGRERMRLRLLEEKSRLEMARAELEKVGGLV